MAFFAARRDISGMFLDDHIVHVEGFLPSSWQTMQCGREIGKAEGHNLTYRGIAFISPDAAVPLINTKGNIV